MIWRWRPISNALLCLITLPFVISSGFLSECLGLVTLPVAEVSMDTLARDATLLTFAVNYHLLVINLLQLVLAGGVGLITGLLFGSDSGSGGEVLSSAFNNLLSIFLAPLGIVAAILLYYDMRIRKEGFDLEMLSRELTSEPEPMMAASTPSR